MSQECRVLELLVVQDQFEELVQTVLATEGEELPCYTPRQRSLTLVGLSISLP
jgi:hypothetical protein